MNLLIIINNILRLSFSDKVNIKSIIIVIELVVAQVNKSLQ